VCRRSNPLLVGGGRLDHRTRGRRPLSAGDGRRAVGLWPDLAALARQHAVLVLLGELRGQPSPADAGYLWTGVHEPCCHLHDAVLGQQRLPELPVELAEQGATKSAPTLSGSCRGALCCALGKSQVLVTKRAGQAPGEGSGRGSAAPPCRAPLVIARA